MLRVGGEGRIPSSMGRSRSGKCLLRSSIVVSSTSPHPSTTLAQDHYVSQTHLRGWLPDLQDRLRAVRKRDLKTCRPGTHSVGTTDEGSTNAYLQDPRVVEEYLRLIEPKYSSALGKLEAGKPDGDAIYALAGFVTYVQTCSPTGMRLHAGGLRGLVEEAYRRADAADEMPPSPSELGGRSISDLLECGEVAIEVDHKYPQAIGITQFLDIVTTTANSAWEVMLNGHGDTPYFTSDYPVAVEPTATASPQIANRVVPLSPRVAVRIHPQVDKNARRDPSLSGFRYVVRSATRKDVRVVNTLVVRAAENLVIYKDELDWILPFVRKHAAFRTESFAHRIPTGDGMYLINQFRIVEANR